MTAPRRWPVRRRGRWAPGGEGPAAGGEARARSGSAAVAAARIAELTRVESQPAPLRDDLTVVAVRIQRGGRVKVVDKRCGERSSRG